VGRAIGGGVRSIEVGEGVVINGLLLGLLLGVGLGEAELLGVGVVDNGEGDGLGGVEGFIVGGSEGLLIWGDLVVVGVGVAIGLKQRSI
jgi:hypothetical protein